MRNSFTVNARGGRSIASGSGGTSISEGSGEDIISPLVGSLIIAEGAEGLSST